MPDAHAVTPHPPWSPGQTPQPEGAASLSPGLGCLEARTLHAAQGDCRGRAQRWQSDLLRLTDWFCLGFGGVWVAMVTCCLWSSDPTC